MKHGPSLATILALAAIALIPAPAGATDTSDPWWTPRIREKDTVVTATLNTAEEPTVPDQTSTGSPAAAPAAPPTATVPPILPDSSLTKAIAILRESPIGTEPNSVAYLDLIAAGKATAAQVNDFAAYIAKKGMPKMAVTFQDYALRLDPNDSTLWLNLGTIRRTNGSWSSAIAAFKQAIELDPANALAHYNLGSVYDAEKDYDAAIEEYRRALVIDPDLADPRKNPQVVNNDNLLAVKLQIYSNQAGSLGLPLLQMQKPVPPPKAATTDKP